jgi:hypothetical protein
LISTFRQLRIYWKISPLPAGEGKNISQCHLGQGKNMTRGIIKKEIVKILGGKTKDKGKIKVKRVSTNKN